MEKSQDLQGEISPVCTIFNGIVIERRQGNIPVTETDLENYVAESVWKTFDQYRPQIADRLSIPELDVALIDAKVVGIRIDGHRVINPVGFTGKKIEVSVLVTSSSRKFNSAKYALAADLIESGSLGAYAISEDQKISDIIYVEVGRNSSKVCIKKGDTSSCLGEINWGENSVITAVAGIFQCDNESAKLIYERFRENNVSPEIQSKVMKKINLIFKEFIDKIADIALEVGGIRKLNFDSIYLNSSVFPDPIYNRSFLLNSRRTRVINAGTMNNQKFLYDKEEIYGRLNKIAESRVKWQSQVAQNLSFK